MRILRRALFASLLLAAPPATALEPTVILLSFDGVRYDYLDRGSLPAFERIAREGLRAEGLVPVFPASTFPNHVSMATCTPVDRHGIVANRFLDRERGLFSYGNDASWIEAEPLWATAERQGVRAAAFFWVGSETDWEGVGASYRQAPFDGRIGEARKVDQILAWLDLPDAERPQLILSWWHGADTAGHHYGPDAGPVLTMLRGQDAELLRLLEALDARDAWGATTLLIVSDHGMVATHEVVDVRALLSEHGMKARVISASAFAHVFLEDPERTADAIGVLEAVEGLSVWSGAAMPAELRYAHPTRMGDVFVLAEPPRRVGSAGGARGAFSWIHRTLGRAEGSHGYLPSLPEMRGILVGMGRGIRAGTRVGPVSNLDVAPTVTRLLGIEPPRDCEGAPIEAVGTP